MITVQIDGATVAHEGAPPFRAVSASDKTDDWPFWFVVGSDGANRMRAEGGLLGGKFVPRADAEQAAARLNEVQS